MELCSFYNDESYYGGEIEREDNYLSYNGGETEGIMMMRQSDQRGVGMLMGSGQSELQSGQPAKDGF